MPDLPSPDRCEEIFYAALEAGDAKGVEAALLVMTPQDPRRAARLLDNLTTALAVAAGIRKAEEVEGAR